MNRQIKPGNLLVDRSNNETPSLFCNLYFSHEQQEGCLSELEALALRLHARYNRLFGGEDVRPEPLRDMEGWSTASFREFQFVYLRIYRGIVGNEDTWIMQIGLSAETEALIAWPAMRVQLNDFITPWLADNIPPLQETSLNFLGYSLYYCGHAALSKSGTSSLTSNLISLARPLSEDNHGIELASHRFENGVFHLTGITQQVNVPSCLCYIAIAEKGQSGKFLYNQIFKDQGDQLTADAFVHKANYQSAQLSNPSFHDYNHTLEELARRSSQVFQLIEQRILARQDSDEIPLIAAVLRKAFLPYQKYKRLRLSVNIQEKNFEYRYIELLKVAEPRDLYKFLLDRLTMQAEAADLSIQRGDIILEFAKYATGLIETQELRRSNDQNTRTQMIIATAGLGFAFVSIFDNEAATGLLKALGWVDKHLTTDQVFWADKLGIKALTGILVVSLTVIVYKIVVYFLNRSSHTKLSR